MIRGLQPGCRAALIISECQRGVIEAGRSPFPDLVEQTAARGIVAKTAVLADAFRAAGLPVVHAHFAHQPDYADLPMTSVIMAVSKKTNRLTIGSPDTLAVAGLEPQPTDIVHSRSFSLVAFHGTDLDTRLRNMGVQTLVLSGVSTNVAIQGMSVCASDLGYQVIVAEDCIAGASPQSHDFIVKNFLPLYSTVASSQDIMEELKAHTKG